MSEYEIIDKISAARRQLKTAIWMFFERKDPVAIHTLSWAGYQILIDLCKQKGIEREIEDSPILKEMGVLNEVITAMRKPHNFFKHSDKEPSSTVKLFPDSNYLVLLMACQYFIKLTGDLFFEGKILQTWFYLKYPERSPKDWAGNFDKTVKTISPNDYEFFLEMLLKNKT
jgi:hypothetical protein